MVSANQTAAHFFEINVEDEGAVERESGWYDWDDLNGTHVQTDPEGLLRVIMQTDTQEESLVWVEKRFVTIEEDEGSGAVSETESVEENLKNDRPMKRLKVSTHTSPSLLSCLLKCKHL
jgi:hypothetical protein